VGKMTRDNYCQVWKSEFSIRSLPKKGEPENLMNNFVRLWVIIYKEKEGEKCHLVESYMMIKMVFLNYWKPYEILCQISHLDFRKFPLTAPHLLFTKQIKSADFHTSSTWSKFGPMDQPHHVLLVWKLADLIFWKITNVERSVILFSKINFEQIKRVAHNG